MTEYHEPDTPAADPFPRMIIVCIIISAILFPLIVGVLAFEFMKNAEQQTDEFLDRKAPGIHQPAPGTAPELPTASIPATS